MKPLFSMYVCVCLRAFAGVYIEKVNCIVILN